MISTFICASSVETAVQAAVALKQEPWNCIFYEQYLQLKRPERSYTVLFKAVDLNAIFADAATSEVYPEIAAQLTADANIYMAITRGLDIAIQCCFGPKKTDAPILYRPTLATDFKVPATPTPAEPGMLPSDYIPAVAVPHNFSFVDAINHAQENPDLRGKVPNIPTVVLPLVNLAGYLAGDPREDGIRQVPAVWADLYNGLKDHEFQRLFAFMQALIEHHEAVMLDSEAFPAE